MFDLLRRKGAELARRRRGQRWRKRRRRRSRRRRRRRSGKRWKKKGRCDMGIGRREKRTEVTGREGGGC